jgi:CHAT domain-containing protein
LAPDEALLAYMSGPERLELFVVRRDRIAHRSAAIGDKELARRVRLVRAALQKSGDRNTTVSALGNMYDALLGGSESALAGITRLVIVPHGALSALPFAALWHRSNGMFLVEERVISYLPSAAALGAASRSGRVKRLTVFAPMPDALPGTMREARTIVALVPDSHLMTGNRSSEAAVRSALMHGDNVHIASHGSHNPQNPLFSRMTVGKRLSSLPREDGRLEVHEIMGIPVTSPLVFLSGCETALGSSGDSPFSASSDEGSLSQAFLFAGASTVVATLWEVNDADAATVAASFYKRIEHGETYSTALANAQREAAGRRKGFTWAAYTVSGSS